MPSTPNSNLKQPVQQDQQQRNASSSLVPKPQLQPPAPNPYGATNPPVIPQVTSPPTVGTTQTTVAVTVPTTVATTTQVLQPPSIIYAKIIKICTNK